MSYIVVNKVYHKKLKISTLTHQLLVRNYNN